jgi:hypothetical protein
MITVQQRLAWQVAVADGREKEVAEEEPLDSEYA